MINPSQSLIITMVSRTLAAFIQVFGIYVIIHGHYSPGGGFQGGALLAAGILLLRMSEGRERSQRSLVTELATPIASIGAIIFAATGIVVLFFGGNYLDYGAVPVPGLTQEWVRYYGILIVEIGIGIAVMTGLVSIFDDLVRPDRPLEPVPSTIFPGAQKKKEEDAS